jgi:hypothetical protein
MLPSRIGEDWATRTQQIPDMTRSIVPSSLVMCAGLVLTYLLLPEGGVLAIYRTAAIGATLALGLGILMEGQHGVRSLVRTDLVMIVGLFGLTLVEFFFPQQEIVYVVGAKSAIQGVEALFIGFSGLIIGRNFASTSHSVTANAPLMQLSPAAVFRIFVASLFLGNLHMLLAVGFDPMELVHQMLGPRFSQSWSRGTTGGLNDLLGVFGSLLLYLVPAVAGSVLANPSSFKTPQKVVVVVGLLFTLFSGFAGGTRNVFAIYLILFAASYTLFRPRVTWRFVAVLAFLVSLVLYLSAYYMLQFREVGLRAYIENGGETAGYKTETLFIDNNLITISQLTDVFPRHFEYLGAEFPLYVILRPVPRAFWPSKPERPSVDTLDALGVQVQGMTITSTFVGEAYMTGGYAAVLVAGLLFGWLGGWWNRFGSNLGSNVGVALYTSGFFAATLSMRSTIWTTTAILPTFAIWLYARSRRARQRPRRLRPIDRKPTVTNNSPLRPPPP